MADGDYGHGPVERLRITILGCGASPGVPRIGNDWGACDPSEPKNRRTRSAILIDGFRADRPYPTRILVDSGPDLRNQLLDARVDRLDGVLYTHAHADHTHGIDDLRPMFVGRRRRVDVYMDEPTSVAMHARFGYCFQTPAGSNYPPILAEHRVTPGTPVTVHGQGGPIEVLPVLQDHGDIVSLGFRFGDVAYSTDLKRLPPESIEALQGLDIWIVDALRRMPHPSHMNLEESLSCIERMRPKRAILTDMHTDLDYRTLCASLPAHIVPAYDGMSFDIDAA
ncbi:MAG: MBL fold metallo-hydrolase [Pseudolabrys sp.]|jgi:phosphoribosyl 1,2-cyclic phosphate phosphodiesterase